MTENMTLDLAKAQRRLAELEEADQAREYAIQAREAEKAQLAATIAQLEQAERDQQWEADKQLNAALIQAANAAGENVLQAIDDLAAGRGTFASVLEAYRAHCRAWDSQQQHVTRSGHAYSGWQATERLFGQFRNAILPGVMMQQAINRATGAEDRRFRQGIVYGVLGGQLRNPGPDFDPQAVSDRELRNRRRADYIGAPPLMPG